MNQEALNELFIEQVRDLYDAEKQITKALPKLAKASVSEQLAGALRSHLEETQNHVSRLEQVFEIVGVPAKGKTCKGMKGLLEEGSEAIREEDKGSIRDLAIIAGCQKVEHYEMSAYGTIRTLAEQLGNEEAVDLLQQTEDEEKAADQKLTEIATALYETPSDDIEGEAEEETSSSVSSTRSPANPTPRKAALRKSAS
jgi:ferritin-like metal-binding protein YciE